MSHFTVSCLTHEMLNQSESLKQKLEMIRYDENENEHTNEM
jgi:hypothetical protein